MSQDTLPPYLPGLKSGRAFAPQDQQTLHGEILRLLFPQATWSGPILAGENQKLGSVRICASDYQWSILRRDGTYTEGRGLISFCAIYYGHPIHIAERLIHEGLTGERGSATFASSIYYPIGPLGNVAIGGSHES